jgi:hypothetical protein
MSESLYWPHWRIKSTLGFETSMLTTSFNPICRLSDRMLSAIGAFAALHRCLTFHEFLFATLAKTCGMRVRFFDGVADKVLIRYRPLLTNRDLNRYIYRYSSIIAHPVKHVPRWPDKR